MQLAPDYAQSPFTSSKTHRVTKDPGAVRIGVVGRSEKTCCLEWDGCSKIETAWLAILARCESSPGHAAPETPAERVRSGLIALEAGRYCDLSPARAAMSSSAPVAGSASSPRSGDRGRPRRKPREPDITASTGR